MSRRSSRPSGSSLGVLSPGTIDEAKHVFKKDEIDLIISEFDKDGDGHLDFDEFMEFFAGCGGDETLRDAFDLFDLDRNGLISAKNLHSVMMKLGEGCSLSECRRMISSVDRDGDGNVNFEEFKEMMTISASD
ncbi:hypothetical protein SAY86_013235 [Trapa natans]|uniref:EF-hand domain-containing protein n=1 Tax=Trapa natans TaxID=22666 RepID=A0AAN7RCE1_TRANT|nr:hypothetical protein SAY86_013235 [Trapa natans]